MKKSKLKFMPHTNDFTPLRVFQKYLLSNFLDIFKVQANFLAECAKVRALTHLNSFSYDFHLRHVQYFLSRQRLVFPKGFRLTSMLGNLMNVYIYPPKFSWNHLCKGNVLNPYLSIQIFYAIYRMFGPETTKCLHERDKKTASDFGIGK